MSDQLRPQAGAVFIKHSETKDLEFYNPEGTLMLTVEPEDEHYVALESWIIQTVSPALGSAIGKIANWRTRYQNLETKVVEQLEPQLQFLQQRLDEVRAEQLVLIAKHAAEIDSLKNPPDTEH